MQMQMQIMSPSEIARRHGGAEQLQPTSISLADTTTPLSSA